MTFFYRQMRELIDGGYLYIAQPPLFKAAKGKSAIYLKDERSLDDHLITSGLEGATFRLGDGSVQSHDDLRRTVDIARSVANLVKPLSLSRRVTSQAVIEQAAIAGALNPEIIADTEHAKQTADYIARRLDAVSSPTARSAIRRSASSSSSRAIRPAARPSRGATEPTRRSCRCAARS